MIRSCLIPGIAEAMGCFYDDVIEIDNIRYLSLFHFKEWFSTVKHTKRIKKMANKWLNDHFTIAAVALENEHINNLYKKKNKRMRPTYLKNISYTLKDIIRICHPKPKNKFREKLFKGILKDEYAWLNDLEIPHGYIFKDHKRGPLSFGN